MDEEGIKNGHQKINVNKDDEVVTEIVEGNVGFYYGEYFNVKFCLQCRGYSSGLTRVRFTVNCNGANR